ncbi:hypothetical protein HJFPF1_08269 [Paramyrothecium foliicola]|nr:hypothetical protein HJFPF1_08269 [Paramyrothecium foliicola]
MCGDAIFSAFAARELKEPRAEESPREPREALFPPDARETETFPPSSRGNTSCPPASLDIGGLNFMKQALENKYQPAKRLNDVFTVLRTPEKKAIDAD